MLVLARGLLAALILILLTFPPSYGCDSCETNPWTADVSADRIRLAAISALEAGWPEELVSMAVAIAMAESLGDPNAVGDKGIQTDIFGPSVGLMQVRTMFNQRGTGGPRDIEILKDPVQNMRAARQIFEGTPFRHNGRTWYEAPGWQHWSVYNDNSYERHLPDAERALQEWLDIRQRMD